MPNKKLNPKLLWIQFEDILVPRLGLTVCDRAVYSYLLRHSLLIGKRRLHFAIRNVAHILRLSHGPVRKAVRRLNELGALRLLERSKTGHLVEMRKPEHIRALCEDAGPPAGLAATTEAGKDRLSSKLEATDFMSTPTLRKALHDRDRGACFYCLRLTLVCTRCLDHVVPRARFGRNSYRNLVSCCLECNTRKSEMPAPDFLRLLYRKARLTPAELDARLQALKDLAAGKLRPAGS